ncbi:caspase recruitment domain-containing protein 8-like [Enoplosus armatus]|uniref:caspase recruitment domain-containing protein 8-like n=1 Tax=Enoplosus armatus TaxID=215367 RepID=UPI0039916D27
MRDCVEEEEDRSESPVSSHQAMKSDWSKERPPVFSNEPGPSDTKSVHIKHRPRCDEEDQLCPEGPERLKQQQQLLCREALYTNEKFSFTPERLPESRKTSYSFRCPGPGVYQCALTGLVFVVAQEVELQYKIVQWDESVLQSAGKMAAEPLFNIKCSEEAAVCQLHLPHCDTKEALLPDGLLSVVHIADDGMSILKPLEITDTHVVVSVPHLSAFGIVWDIVKRLWTKPVIGQVLLFLGPPNPKTQRQKLNVLLLPSNIPLDEVSAQQRHCENIQSPSKCKLKYQSYTLHCPQASKIQPKRAEFDLEFGPNYHPTFEVRLPTNTEEVTLMVQDQRQMEVWEHEADLTGPRRETPQRNVPAQDRVLAAQYGVPAAQDGVLAAQDGVPAAQDGVLAAQDGVLEAQDRVPADKRLASVRTQFLERVSEPVLNQLLDKLLEHDVINDDETQSFRTKVKAEKARDVIDTVRRKGPEASSVLIATLCEVDQHLSRVLNFR